MPLDAATRKIIILGSAGLVGLVMVPILLSGRVGSGATSRGGGRSERQRRALEAIEAVVPSAYPSERFERIAPGYDPDDPELPQGFTTCGYLPAYVGQALGYKDGVTRWGVEGLRERGIALGAWVDWAPGKRPPPLAFYGRARKHRKRGEPLTADNILRHVGVVIQDDTERGGKLKTADTGQGTPEHQAADYLYRSYDAKTGATENGVIPGWIDLNRLPPPAQSQFAESVVTPHAATVAEARRLLALDREGRFGPSNVRGVADALDARFDDPDIEAM